MTSPAPRALKREVPVDNGGDPGQDLENGLHHPPNAWSSELAEVYRDHQSRRQRHGHGDGRDEHRARDQGQDAEVLLGEERRPLPVREEVLDRYLAEERNALQQQRQDDANGCRDGEQGAHLETTLDQPLEDASEGAPRPSLLNGLVHYWPSISSREASVTEPRPSNMEPTTLSA